MLFQLNFIDPRMYWKLIPFSRRFNKNNAAVLKKHTWITLAYTRQE